MTNEETKMLGILYNATLPHMIKIPDTDYYVGETQVTCEQYKSYCEATGIAFPGQPEPYSPDNPVTNVNYWDAIAYTEWLAEITGNEYRLPTEEEYELYAGDHTVANEDIAVYAQAHIQPVKTKKPNKYGLYDVLGLVWEWTSTKAEDA